MKELFLYAIDSAVRISQNSFRSVQEYVYLTHLSEMRVGKTF